MSNPEQPTEAQRFYHNFAGEMCTEKESDDDDVYVVAEAHDHIVGQLRDAIEKIKERAQEADPDLAMNRLAEIEELCADALGGES